MKVNLTITNAAFEVSKKGSDMIHITLKSDVGCYIQHYITMLPDNQAFTNKLLEDFFNAFDIKEGNFKLDEWKGHTGEAEVVDSEFNGRTYKKVKFFVKRKFVPSPEIQKVLDQIKHPV